ncbi:hypothetical protein AYI68_g6379, partial [Smittium mucronatum]
RDQYPNSKDSEEQFDQPMDDSAILSNDSWQSSEESENRPDSSERQNDEMLHDSPQENDNAFANDIANESFDSLSDSKFDQYADPPEMAFIDQYLYSAQDPEENIDVNVDLDPQDFVDVNEYLSCNQALDSDLSNERSDPLDSGYKPDSSSSGQDQESEKDQVNSHNGVDDSVLLSEENNQEPAQPDQAAHQPQNNINDSELNNVPIEQDQISPNADMDQSFEQNDDERVEQNDDEKANSNAFDQENLQGLGDSDNVNDYVDPNDLVNQDLEHEDALDDKDDHVLDNDAVKDNTLLSEQQYLDSNNAQEPENEYHINEQEQENDYQVNEQEPENDNNINAQEQENDYHINAQEPENDYQLNAQEPENEYHIN